MIQVHQERFKSGKKSLILKKPRETIMTKGTKMALRHLSRSLASYFFSTLPKLSLIYLEPNVKLSCLNRNNKSDLKKNVRQMLNHFFFSQSQFGFIFSQQIVSWLL